MSHRPYPNADRALRQLDRHGRTLTAVPLTELSATDLMTLAVSRPDGPRPEEVEEAARRMQKASTTMSEALEKFGLHVTFARTA